MEATAWAANARCASYLIHINNQSSSAELASASSIYVVWNSCMNSLESNSILSTIQALVGMGESHKLSYQLNEPSRLGTYFTIAGCWTSSYSSSGSGEEKLGSTVIWLLFVCNVAWGAMKQLGCLGPL